MTSGRTAADLIVGLVLIGRNEGERLRRCLASIDCAAHLVVYVDSGSSDGSVALARAMGAEVVELDTTVPFTAARARNAGWHRLVEVAPEISAVQFIDGDCELEAGWLTAASGFLAGNPAAAVVCGRRRERFPEASPYNAMCDAEWNTPIGRADACGGDALMRLSALAAVGGFDPAIVAGEEPELCTRLRADGWGIWRIDAPMTIHDAAIGRFGQWWVRATRSGFGYAQTYAATRSRAQPLYGRELRRAVVWGGLVPGAAAVAAVASPLVGAVLAGSWVAQGLRLVHRHGRRRGALLMLAKPAELLGAMRWVRQQVFASVRPHAFAYK
jgi:GT2 family glycosyltransferase